MAFKFVAVFALLAVVNGGLLPAAQVYQTAPTGTLKTIEEYDTNPQYKFGYNVQDNLSGDSKRQVEERDGDVVRGEYSLIDADGYKRTVQYTADPINGFNAVVNREPLVKALVARAVVKTVAPAYTTYTTPPVVKTVAPAYTRYAAPAFVNSVAPVYTTYSAPATYLTHH